jgi:hypothetical protein
MSTGLLLLISRALGNFISFVLTNFSDAHELRSIATNLTNPDPVKRTTAARILALPIFSDNKLIYISEFLRNNTLHNPEKRRAFFL